MVRQEGGPQGLSFEKGVSQVLESLVASWHVSPLHSTPAWGQLLLQPPPPLWGEEPPFLEIPSQAGKETGGLENTH